MKKVVAGAVSTAALLASALSPSHAAAIACGPQPTIIGTIRSASTSRGATLFTLDNAYYYDPTSLRAKDAAVSIDAYNRLAFGYAQNGHQIPAKFATKNYAVMNTDGTPYISPVWVSSDALQTISYKTGDILIAGPDAPCNAVGFVGFFGQYGTIEGAIAPEQSYDGKNTKYPSYTYGSETVTLTPGDAYNCAPYSENGVEIAIVLKGTKCTVSMTFSENGKSFSIRPPESGNFATGPFSKTTLIESPQTTITATEPAGGFVAGYLPNTSIAPRYTLTFTSSSPAPSPSQDRIIEQLKQMIITLTQILQHLLNLRTGQ